MAIHANFYSAKIGSDKSRGKYPAKFLYIVVGVLKNSSVSGFPTYVIFPQLP